jgi:hypothetical protein
VLSKLPLVRFCQPTDPSGVRYWYELLGSIHVTFAICSANGRVLAAIDLDNDRSGSPPALQIKQAVLGACRVRYLRCPADHLPSIPELQLLVPQAAMPPHRGPQPAPTARCQARDRLWQPCSQAAGASARRCGRTRACSRIRSSAPTPALDGRVSSPASAHPARWHRRAAKRTRCRRRAPQRRRDAA